MSRLREESKLNSLPFYLPLPFTSLLLQNPENEPMESLSTSMPDSISGTSGTLSNYKPGSLFEHQNHSSSSLTSTHQHHRRNPSQPLYSTYSPSQNLQSLLSGGEAGSPSTYSHSLHQHQRSESARSATDLLRGPFSERASPSLGSSILFEDEDDGNRHHHQSHPINSSPGAIGSPPIGSGSSSLRRHQSLSQARGAATAGIGSSTTVNSSNKSPAPIGGSMGRASLHRQLSARSSDLLLREHALNSSSAGSSARNSVGNHQQDSRNGSNSNSNSPLTPSSFSSAPWNREPSNIDSRRAASPASITQTQSANPGISVASPSPPQERFQHGHSHSLSSTNQDNDNSLMNIHASLAKMDIRSSSPSWAVRNRASTQESHSSTSVFDHDNSSSSNAGQSNSASSSTTLTRPELSPISIRTPTSAELPTTPGSGRKLPSLITNREVLARGALANPKGGNNPSLAGPASAAAWVPEIGRSHRRNDSENNFTSLRNAMAGSTNGTGAQGATQVGNASSRSDLAALMGPFSATPAPGWGSDLHAQLLSRGGDDPNNPTASSYLNGIGESPISAQLPSQWGLSLGVGSPIQELQTGTPSSAVNMNALALSYALQQQQQQLQFQQQRTAALQAQLARTGALGGNQQINDGLEGFINMGMGGLNISQSQFNGNPPSSTTPFQLQNPNVMGIGGQPILGTPFLPTNFPTMLNQNGMMSPPLPQQARSTSAMGNRQTQNQNQNPSTQGPRREVQQLDPETERLIQLKGYNPLRGSFDTTPQDARFFVIKR